jgi:hypothetical protein
VEVLSHYEEGTFTPAIEFGNNAITSHDSRFGRYILIGKMCHITVGARVNVAGAATGGVTIVDLPFTSASVSHILPIQISAMPDTTQTMYVGVIPSSQSYIAIKNLQADGEMPTMDEEQWASTGGLGELTGTYEIA